MKKMLWVKDRDQTWQEIRDIAPTLATTLTRIELPKVRSSTKFRGSFYLTVLVGLSEYFENHRDTSTLLI